MLKILKDKIYDNLRDKNFKKENHTKQERGAYFQGFLKYKKYNRLKNFPNSNIKFQKFQCQNFFNNEII